MERGVKVKLNQRQNVGREKIVNPKRRRYKRIGSI